MYGLSLGLITGMKIGHNTIVNIFYFHMVKCLLGKVSKKTKKHYKLGFLAEVRGAEGSEGVPGPQPVNGHFLNVPPKVPGNCSKSVI